MRLLTWFSKIVVSTVLITTLSVFTTWYVVNLVVEDIFRQFQLPVLGKKVQFSDFVTRLSEDMNIVKRSDGGGLSEKVDQSAATGLSPSTAKDQEVSAAPEAYGNSGSQASSGASQEDAVAVWGSHIQEESGGQDASEQNKVIISTEEFAKKKDSITDEDKMKIFSLLVSKLPQDDMQRISTLMEEGITSEELKEVDALLQTHLKKEEYQQLADILSKY